LIDELRDAGVHTVAWDGNVTSGEKAPSGTYICVLKVTPSERGASGSMRQDRRKLMLMR
jgi:flagellar hook assembly protein FlgD